MELQKFVALLLTVVLACQAQPPPPVAPPQFSETFVAQYKIFRNRQAAFIHGSGSWIRNAQEGHFLDTLSLKYTTHSVNREHIRFFDKHTEYVVEFDDADRLTNCTVSLIPEEQKPPLAWDWLEEAHYTPYDDPASNNTYRSWILHTRHGSMQVVVKDVEPVKPYLLIQVSNAGDQEKWEFIMFETVIPPESIFDIPQQCPAKKNNHSV